MDENGTANMTAGYLSQIPPGIGTNASSPSAWNK
jgi:hypothetical protein